MKTYYATFTLLIVFLLDSCATVFNGTRQYVSIHTNQPAMIYAGRDSTKHATQFMVTDLPRTKIPLEVEAFTDSVHKIVQVRAHTSLSFYLNLLTFWPGIFVDMQSPGRYAYPPNVYLDMHKREASYSVVKPLDSLEVGLKNQIKFTPLKLFDFNNASFTLGYERSLSSTFSVNMNGSYLLTHSIWDHPYPRHLQNQIQGFGYAVEGKYFFRHTGPVGPYLSLEFNYLKEHYVGQGTIYDMLSIPDSIFGPMVQDTAIMRKQDFNFNFKFGYQRFYKRLVVDFSVGLGLRYKNAYLYDPKHPGMYFGGTNPFLTFSADVGKYLTPTVPINVRVGWVF